MGEPATSESAEPRADPKIVLIEHRDDFRAIYGLNLNVYVGAEVLVATTVKEVGTLVENNDCALIFVNGDAYSSDIVQDLYYFLKDKGHRVPVFAVGKTKAPQSEFTIFDSNIQLRRVLQSIAKSLEVTAKFMAEREVPDYYPLAMEFIVPGFNCATEVYCKEGEEYQILFNTEDVILQDTLEDLEDRGVPQLYVKAERRLRFVNNLTLQISAKLNDPNLSPEERVTTTAKGYQMVMEQARKIGISQTTLETANACISSMETIVDQAPNLQALLERLKGDESSYRYRHSLLTNYVGSHIIKKSEWGSQEQQRKLAFVAFFHDIALFRDEYAMIHSERELSWSRFNEKEKTLIRNHALLAAKAIHKIEKLPFGADTIIKQHHGSKNGNTLDDIALGISPLAIVFIFAEEWVRFVIEAEEKNENYEKADIINMLKQKYNVPAFRKIIPTLYTLEI